MSTETKQRMKMPFITWKMSALSASDALASSTVSQLLLLLPVPLVDEEHFGVFGVFGFLGVLGVLQALYHRIGA